MNAWRIQTPANPRREGGGACAARRARVPLRPIVWVACIFLAGPATLPSAAARTERDAPPVYGPRHKYPVFEEIEKARQRRQAEQDSLRALVDRRYADQEQRAKESELDLRVDWSHIPKPSGPEAFPAAFHFPPVAQYASGTCWAFCSTSFFESEVFRRTGERIKLSEMWAVYWEYVEKARRFVREYGHSAVNEGSQCHGTREVYRLHGAVPASAYAGILATDDRHDHVPLAKEIARYLAWVKENNYWDEEKVIGYVRAILDSHLGRPSERFEFAGRVLTPRTFLEEVLRLDMDDYVEIVSTLREPFGERVLQDVPDNWRRRDDYLNLRLDDFYEVICSALRAGYTVALGGDVSEPGMDGTENAAIIPSWDIPAEYVDQGSRELRIDNQTTTDDHGTHAVGFLRYQGRDWLLVKDSNRSSRLGRFKGYYFYDGDYVKLKTLSAMIHRDRLERFLATRPRARGEAFVGKASPESSVPRP